MNKKVRTRIAPSPTGTLHIGTAHTALFNYLFAKQNDGDFVVRIEDTDKERSDKKFEKDIFAGLEWLGLKYDETARQSERTELYTEKIDQLIKDDKAYVSKELARDGSGKEVEVVRLKNPGKKVSFKDVVKGEITVDTTDLGDFVIARSRTDPLYHLAVVVDDADMGITHIIRGDDHVSNTPRQILIQEALGVEQPVYAHMPLILAKDRSKLSKRKGAVAVTEYKSQGFLPEAINNYLALLGWNPGSDKEIYTMEELIKDFTIEDIQKGAAIFDIEKLKWLNKEHRRKLPKDEILKEVKDLLKDYSGIIAAIDRSEKVLDDMLERFSVSFELVDAVKEGEFEFYENVPTFDKEKLIWKKDKNPEKVSDKIKKIIELISSIDTATFTYDNVKNAVWNFAEEEGRGDVLWPMRYALSGKDKSPDPFLLSEALGKDETIKRLTNALEMFT